MSSRRWCGLRRPPINGESLGCAMRRARCCCLLVACGGPQIQERKADRCLQARPGHARGRATQGRRSARPRRSASGSMPASARRRSGRKTITEQIDYASQLLTPLLGVRLEVERVQGLGSHRRSAARRSRALATVDDGKDATWVIGYITPGDIASKAMSELGNRAAARSPRRSCAAGPRRPRPTRSHRRCPISSRPSAHEVHRRASPPQADRRAAAHARAHARRDRRDRSGVDPESDRTRRSKRRSPIATAS